jgi:glycerophosphoryl diester phosphodiesterase
VQSKDDKPLGSGSDRQEAPIGFAHRGGIHELPGGGVVTENTLEAFEKAIAAGARGIEADIWSTADRECVIHHDLSVKMGSIPRPIWMTQRSDLPDFVPTVEQLYERCGTQAELSLDCLSRRAGNLAIDAAIAAGDGAPSRLWLCTFVYSHFAAWRKKSEDVRLVDSTPFHRPAWLVRKRIAKAASFGVYAFNAHHTAWSRQLVESALEGGLVPMAWDVNDKHTLARMQEIGIQAIYSDDIDLVLQFQKGL